MSKYAAGVCVMVLTLSVQAQVQFTGTVTTPDSGALEGAAVVVGDDQRFGARRTGRAGFHRRQFDAENAAAHAQFGHERGHGVAQAPAAGRACLAEQGRGALPFAGGLFSLHMQLRAADIGASKQFKLDAKAVALGGKLVHRHPVLAGEVVQAGEAVFQRR